MAMTVELKDHEKALRELAFCKKSFADGARRAIIDVGTKGIKTAAQQQVREVYNVSIADVNDKFSYKETGSVSIDGISIPFFRCEWEQERSFTIGHASFKMKMGGRGKKKSVQWTPMKGGGARTVKSESGYPVFIQSAKGSPPLPWNRLQQKTWGRNGKQLPIDMIPSHLSVPQMIDNEKVNPRIEDEVHRRLGLIDKASAGSAR